MFTLLYVEKCHVTWWKFAIKKLCRGTAGFDLSGRGYYFANQPPPPPQYPPPYEQGALPYPNFIDNNKLPPPPSNHHQYSQHLTPVIQPEFYQGKPAQIPSSSSSSNSQTQTVSSNAIGVDSGGGSGSSNNNKNNNKESVDNKDKIR